MATDSRLEETNASPEGGGDEAASLGTAGPPRPPRPGKRKGSGRIPIPLPPSRPGLDAVDASAVDGEVEHADELDAAPAVSIDAREEPSFPLMAPRSAPASVPEESFAGLADSVPSEPAAPWRSVPPAGPRSSEVTPPRGVPFASLGDDEERESEPEPTMVGKVAPSLLELSSGGDENTRAFTAPRELIELARRKREERLLSVDEPVENHSTITARPPGGASPDGNDAGDVSKLPAPPDVPVGSREPASDVSAAPPVERSPASELDPASEARPAAPVSASWPEIEIDPASELSPSARRAVLASTGRNAPISVSISAAPQASERRWWLLFALLVVAAVAIARWRDLAALWR